MQQLPVGFPTFALRKSDVEDTRLFALLQGLYSALQNLSNTVATVVNSNAAALPFTSIALFNPSLSPASVAANTTAEQSFTVNGLLATDYVLSVNKPTAQAGLGIVGARATANTLFITFCNVTAAPIVPTASETYKVAVIHA